MSNYPSRPGEMSTARLLALADGIFAIAMTLLVFEIKVPLGASNAGQLRAGLFVLWPKFAACILTFLTLGFSWIGHHNQYVAIRRTDRTFLWINIAFLSAIALVPFSSAMLGEYPFERLAVQIYAGNLALAGALLLLHWWYATRGARLVDRDISPDLVSRTTMRVLIAPVGFLGVIAIAWVSIGVSLALCVGIPIYFMIPGRVDRHWRPPAGPASPGGTD